MDITIDGILAIAIIVFLFMMIYSKLKDLTLRETWDEIIDIFRRD